ncbi:HAD family hydrolase [Actinomadura formosensis]|uniref:HAD family hydrolase n=1 Tax=Actinomadura formosensis TaxID=60706 RepID=UPI0009FC3766|nr:haloacid dehalogenase-like hydrolase [Actinomadura formosensis]
MTEDSARCPLLVLWDVDHTLIENSGVSKETYAAAFGLLTGREAELRARTDGRTDPVIMADLVERHGLTVTAEYQERFGEVLAAALSSRADRLREVGFALPGAREAIAALSAQEGVIQSVVTGNIRANAFTKVATFDLHHGLDFEVGGYGSDDHIRANLVGIARERASAKYGVWLDAGNTVVIGDTPRDVQAGRLGGAYVVAVASGSDGIERLRAEEPDVVLPDLADTAAVVAAVRAVRQVTGS